MQGQAWWAPLAAAGIGAISALLINWLVRRSERKRDDLKWEREAADRRAEREHDARMQWREHRLQVYAEVLASIDKFRMHAHNRALDMRTLQDSESVEPNRPKGPDLIELFTDLCFPVLSSVEIPGGESVGKAVGDAADVCMVAAHRMDSAAQPKESGPFAQRN